MPGRGLGLAGVAAVALLGGGCGTTINVTSYAPVEIGGGQRAIYGGVVYDLENEYRALTTPHPTAWFGIHLPMILAHLIDLPFSFIGDTLTLPITVGETLGISLPPWPPEPPLVGPPPGTVVPVEPLPPPRPVVPGSAYSPVVPEKVP